MFICIQNIFRYIYVTAVALCNYVSFMYMDIVSTSKVSFCVHLPDAGNSVTNAILHFNFLPHL